MYVSCYLIADFAPMRFGSLFYMIPYGINLTTVFMRMVEDYTKPHICNEPSGTSVGINIYAP